MSPNRLAPRETNITVAPLNTQSLGLSSGCTEIDAGARHQFLVAKSYGLAAQVTANTLTGNGAKVGDNRRRQRIPAGLGSNGLSQGMFAVLLPADTRPLDTFHSTR
jgi:hypothetical protein